MTARVGLRSLLFGHAPNNVQVRALRDAEADYLAAPTPEARAQVQKNAQDAITNSHHGDCMIGLFGDRGDCVCSCSPSTKEWRRKMRAAVGLGVSDG